MGGGASKDGLEQATSRAANAAGKIAVSGRYSRLPKRLEDDYQVEKKVLGTGYNGAVFTATHKATGKRFAVKSFHLTGVNGEKRKELETECEIFLMMDHPHVARLADVYEDEKMLNLVMECMEGGELYSRVVKQNGRGFQEREAAKASYQMLLAVNYIHSRKIVHRDLKLENFLYEREDTDHLKLIDFGFSHVWEPNTKMAASCGTLAYVAPEVLGQSYTSQCDLWSLGVVIFILLTGYMPFNAGLGEQEQMQKIRAGKYTYKQAAWDRVSPTAFDFVKKLLVVNATNRMSAEQALEHPWIKNHQEIKDGDADQSVNTEVADALCSFAKASQFKKACMSLMAWSLTNEERQQVRDAFLELDVNKKGTITLQELRQVLTTRFKVQDSEIQSIFEALDTAQDEEIHYTEFLAAMVNTRIAMHDDLLGATFKRFDVDNSGYITRENLQTVLGEQLDSAAVESMIAEADTKGDGQISYEEFIAYLKGGGAAANHLDIAEKMIEKEKTAQTERIAKGEPGALASANTVQFTALQGMYRMTTGRLSGFVGGGDKAPTPAGGTSSAATAEAGGAGTPAVQSSDVQVAKETKKSRVCTVL